MESKTIKQELLLAIDALGMRGPFTLSQVVEYARPSIRAEDWSLADRREAEDAVLMRQAKRLCHQPRPERAIQNDYGHLAEEYRVTLSGLPYAICITPGGGKNSQWVLSFKASLSDWEANLELRRRVVEYVILSQRQIEDTILIMKETGAQSLEALAQQTAVSA